MIRIEVLGQIADVVLLDLEVVVHLVSGFLVLLIALVAARSHRATEAHQDVRVDRDRCPTVAHASRPGSVSSLVASRSASCLWNIV